MLTQAQLAFVHSAAQAAVVAERATGCIAELTLAQACVESGWGKSVPNFNALGIKADGGGSGVQYQISKEFINGTWETSEEAFETYASLTDCFIDHGRLITDPHSVYNPCWHQFGLDHDVDGLITCVARKYATDPGYSKLLLEISRYPELVSALSSARSIHSATVSPPTS